MDSLDQLREQASVRRHHLHTSDSEPAISEAWFVSGTSSPFGLQRPCDAPRSVRVSSHPPAASPQQPPRHQAKHLGETEPSWLRVSRAIPPGTQELSSAGKHTLACLDSVRLRCTNEAWQMRQLPSRDWHVLFFKRLVVSTRRLHRVEGAVEVHSRPSVLTQSLCLRGRVGGGAEPSRPSPAETARRAVPRLQVCSRHEVMLEVTWGA